MRTVLKGWPAHRDAIHNPKTAPVSRELWIPLVVFACLLGQRDFVGNPRFQLNPDAVSYVLRAHQAAQGNFAESMSAVWMPMLSWLAAPLVLLGFSPLWAVVLISHLAGLGCIALVFFFIRFCVGRQYAFWGALVAATDPALLTYSSSALSDVLFTATAGFALFYVIHLFGEEGVAARAGVQWKNVTFVCILGFLLALTRIAGLPLAFALGFIFLLSGRRGILPLFVYLAFIGLIVLGLCTFFYFKLGVFAPSALFPLKKLYVWQAFVKPNPDFFTSLYDGRNTPVGDLEYLRPGARLPVAAFTSPPIPWRWTFTCLTKFVQTIPRLSNVVCLLLSGMGLLGMWRRRPRATLLTLCWLPPVIGTCLGSNIQERFLMPLGMLFYVTFAIGCAELFERLPSKRLIHFLIALAMGLSFISGFSGSNVLLVKSILRRGGIKESGGYWVYRNFGANRRVLTGDNYQSAVDARGIWRGLPHAPEEAILNYIRAKEIEFVILPPEVIKERSPLFSPRRASADAVGFERVWEGGSDVVLRVLPPRLPSK